MAVLLVLTGAPVLGQSASIALVQHTSKDAGNTTSSSLAFPSSNTAGNLIAVAVRAGKSNQVFTVSDSRANTYRQAAQINVTLDAPLGDTLAIFYAENVKAGANTVTVSDTLTGATLRFAILEYSGVALSGALDSAAAAQGSNTSPASGNITTTVSGALVLGAMMSADDRTFTAGSSFTIRDRVPATTNTKLITEDRIQPAAGAASATATLNSSNPWGAVVAAFRPGTTTAQSDLRLTKSHAGSFVRGQSGATYTLSASNVGSAASSGLVTVADSLPTGLTATAIDGPGWTCTLASLNCTRGDVLGVGASYPAVTVTVNVAANAPSSVTNTASVSGGGDANASNNTASDVTTITAAPSTDLSLSKTHNGPFVEGQTGATYTLTVANVSATASAGTVTVVDTLPSGLTATAISGSGWSCTLASLNCSRSDALGAGASYPSITLTVNVAASAPPSVTNTASVSGGGDSSSNNNTANDVTSIGDNTSDLQPPSAPGSLAAAAVGGNRINLNWTPATDNVGVTSYRVEQCEGAGCTDFSEIATVAAAPGGMGPLVASANPNYFKDGSGTSIVLNGSHTWNNLQDWGTNGSLQTLDFDAYVDFLVAHGHNFTFLWYIELPKFCGFPTTDGTPPDFTVGPHPWLRTGPGNASDGLPKFDLTKFNPAYFDRLRARTQALNDAGIYAGVYVFTVEWVGRYRCATDGYPFTASNNINGISDGGGSGSFTMNAPNAITALQDTYVEKVIDTLNDLPNVMWIVSEEAPTNTTWWNNHQIAHIRSYQATKPQQHPIGYGTLTDLGDATVTNSDADWIAPGSRESPTTSCGSGTPRCKVNINDSDHSFFGLWNSDVRQHRNFAWQNFMTGNQAAFMDPYVLNYTREGRNPCPSPNQGICASPHTRYDNFRDNFGYIVRYSRKLNLSAVTPQRSLCSTQYCLAQTPAVGAEYLIYAPNGGSFTVNLSAMSSTRSLSVEWFNPATGVTTTAGTVPAGSSSRSFNPPFSGDAVLYLVDTAGHAGAVTMPSTSYSVTGLGSGDYRFRVRASDAGGNLGPYSSIAGASIQGSDTVLPTAPSGVSATPGAGQISLSWTAATDNVGVTGYRVERCQGAGCSTFAQVGTPAGTTFDDVGLSPSTSYSYRVRATDGAANLGPYSNTATATTTSQVPAGISLRQHLSKDAGSASSSTLAFASSNTAGSLIAVAIRSWPSGQVLTVTDTRGNTYRKAVQLNETSDGMTLAIYYAENVAAGANTVSVANSLSGGTLRFAILEYSGVALASALDVTASAQGNSASPSSGAATSTSGGQLVIGVMSTANSRTFTGGSGFVMQERVPAAPNTKFMVEDRTQASAGSLSATASLNSSDIWGAAMATFRAASSGSSAMMMSRVSADEGSSSATDPGGEAAAAGDSESGQFQDQTMIAGLNRPTSVKFLPNGDMLILEQAGTIWRAAAGATQTATTPFLSLTNVSTTSQQGLLDLALDPQFATNRYYYVLYTSGRPNRDRVSRFTATADLSGTVAGSEKLIHEASTDASAEHHGGALYFGNDGQLYMKTGEQFSGASYDVTSGMLFVGGFVYRGTQFPSQYFGSFFSADDTKSRLRRLTLDASGQANGVFTFEPANWTWDAPFGDIVYVTQGPDGSLYYVDLGGSAQSAATGTSRIRRIRYIPKDDAPDKR